jgi:hypothetical protein
MTRVNPGIDGPWPDKALWRRREKPKPTPGPGDDISGGAGHQTEKPRNGDVGLEN